MKMRNKLGDKMISRNSILIVIFLAIFFGSLSLTDAFLGTFKQNQCVNIKTVLNVTAANISTVSYPNTTLAVSNKAMTKQGYTFNYSFCNTNSIGVYNYDYFDNEGNVYVNSFEITPSGEAGTINSLVSRGIIILILLVLAGIFLYTANSFDPDKWVIKSGMYMACLGVMVIAVSMSIQFATSEGVSRLMTTTLLLLTVTMSFFFIYIFVNYLRNLLKAIKEAKQERDSSDLW